MKNTLKTNYETLKMRIEQAANSNQRPANTIQLLAVSKHHSSTRIRQAYALGLSSFGENYLQEALDKQRELSDLQIEWHYIGRIQSNKTKQLSSHFAWVHTLDRAKIATRLSQQRPAELNPLNCCIQYNISLEASKAGITQDHELLALAKWVATLPNLRLRGLMAIPSEVDAHTGDAFIKLAAKLTWLKSQLTDHSAAVLDTLSMGMSNDLETAIAHGSTMVRVGTALFGERR